MNALDSPWTLPGSVAATRPYVLQTGHEVQLWCPGPAETHLRGWYDPAAALCGAVRATSIWRLHLEDCEFVGRVHPRGEPTLWLYRHARAGGEILVDIAGQAWLPHDDRRRKLGYRFEPIPARSAAFRLGLHLLDDDDASDPGVQSEPWDGADIATVLPFRRR